MRSRRKRSASCLTNTSYFRVSRRLSNSDFGTTTYSLFLMYSSLLTTRIPSRCLLVHTSTSAQGESRTSNYTAFYTWKTDHFHLPVDPAASNATTSSLSTPSRTSIYSAALRDAMSSTSRPMPPATTSMMPVARAQSKGTK